ncbi:hypothetical protein HNY73_016173 [Argiope bruennichi]|uniref:Transposase n=1 Tax=Argiope bruennichi TaxID=94029 RepID=A0A8T0ELD8_ARGBR|nr:hypothetical protein HNY73_016173 [Argiope bruennichi]
MLAVKVDVSFGTVWKIVHDRLRYRKVCPQSVPKQLTDQNKELCMELALQHLFRYHEDPAFLERIVTGDESWCHHYEPETKQNNMQWQHTLSPPPKMFKAVVSAGKELNSGSLIPKLVSDLVKVAGGSCYFACPLVRAG